MTDWDELLKESIGTPEIPGGRGRKKSTRVPLTDEQIRQKTIDFVGRQTESHTLQRKATAPNRVMTKAMQYHTAEANRRRLSHITGKQDGRGWMVTIGIMVFVCSILACVLQAYIR